jgi:glucose-6-phosphate-specific signal transduction histidine kinase
MLERQNRTIQYVVVYVPYFVAWLLGWFMSTQLESISSLASIFIPAGIRISFLLLCRHSFVFLTNFMAFLVFTTIYLAYEHNMNDHFGSMPS